MADENQTTQDAVEAQAVAAQNENAPVNPDVPPGETPPAGNPQTGEPAPAQETPAEVPAETPETREPETPAQTDNGQPVHQEPGDTKAINESPVNK